MRKKIYIRLLLTGFISIVLTALLTIFVYYSMFKKQVNSMVMSTNTVLADVYNSANGNVDFSDFDNIDGRITLIDSDGVVLFDNIADVSKMDNHLNRPEIKKAIEEGIGKSVHMSATLGDDYHYSAIKLSDGKVLRYAESAGSVLSIFVGSVPVLVIISFVIFIICLVYAKYLAAQVITPVNRLAENLDKDDLNTTYDEFKPFVRAIKERNERIAKVIENLQREKDKVEAVMDNMSEGMVLLDENSNVISFNTSSVALLNGNVHSTGRNLRTFTRNEIIFNTVQKAYSGEKASEEINIKGIWLSVLASPVYNKGNIIGVILLIVDITGRKEVEKMRSEFTANVSHELKTPLTSITGYSEMIESGMAEPADVKRFAGKIHSDALRLLTLIGDIIKISELEEFKEVNVQEVDLQEIVTSCFEVLRLAADSKEVTLDSEVVGNPVVCADRDLVELILYNLCDNAVRYNRQGGKVTVTICDNCISVRDTGIGISVQHQSRIFERFYRVDKSRSKETGGTGLGLAIVKHAAKRLQAKVELTSEENKGTEVKVIFKGR